MTVLLIKDLSSQGTRDVLVLAGAAQGVDERGRELF